MRFYGSQLQKLRVPHSFAFSQEITVAHHTPSSFTVLFSPYCVQSLPLTALSRFQMYVSGARPFCTRGGTWRRVFQQSRSHSWGWKLVKFYLGCEDIQLPPCTLTNFCARKKRAQAECPSTRSSLYARVKSKSNKLSVISAHDNSEVSHWPSPISKCLHLQEENRHWNDLSLSLICCHNFPVLRFLIGLDIAISLSVFSLQKENTSWNELSAICHHNFWILKFLTGPDIALSQSVFSLWEQKQKLK